MRWIVEYENSSGELSSRELTDITPSEFGSEHVDAYCNTRGERRSFNIGRLVRVVDAETGEIIRDPRPLLGLPPKPLPPVLPARTSMPPTTPGVPRRSQHSTKAYKGQRNAEKAALQKYYVKEVLFEHFRQLVLAQFDYRCARCGAQPGILDWDHHYPMIRGGHLAPGNLVPLCRACNTAKHDSEPEDFYSAEELERIEAMLERQREMMAFEFDIGRWYASEASRRRYLLEVGFDPALVEKMFNDPEHAWYQGARESSDDDFGVRLTLSANGQTTVARPKSGAKPTEN